MLRSVAAVLPWNGAGLLLIGLIASAFQCPGLKGQVGGEINGFSTIAAGRGGAGGASADSVLNSLRNPATLVDLVRGREAGNVAEVDLRAAWSPFKVDARNGETFRNEDDVGFGPFLGYGQALGEEWAVGVTLVPTFAGSMRMHRRTELQIDDAGTPRHREVAIDQNILQIGLTPTVAVRSGRWSLGASASLRHTRIGLQGISEVDVLETFQGDSGLGGTWGEVLSDFPFFIDDIQAEYDGDAESVLSAVLQLGATYEASEHTVLGIWYRSPSTSSDVEGDVRVDFRPELGPVLDFFGLDSRSNFDVRIEDVRFPQQIGFAVSHLAGERDRVLLDLTWTDWSTTFDGFTALLENPTNGDFEDLVGGDGSTDIDLGIVWQDVFAFALGYEHDLDPRWTLRGGVAWSGNTVTGDIAPGTHLFTQWGLSAGATLWGEEGGNWHFALLAALPTTYVAGDNAQVEDFAFDRYTQAVYQFAAGYELSF